LRVLERPRTRQHVIGRERLESERIVEQPVGPRRDLAAQLLDWQIKKRIPVRDT